MICFCSDNVNIFKSRVKKFISDSKVFFLFINAFLEFIIFSVFILVHRLPVFIWGLQLLCRLSFGLFGHRL